MIPNLTNLQKLWAADSEKHKNETSAIKSFSDALVEKMIFDESIPEDSVKKVMDKMCELFEDIKLQKIPLSEQIKINQLNTY